MKANVLWISLSSPFIVHRYTLEGRTDRHHGTGTFPGHLLLKNRVNKSPCLGWLQGHQVPKPCKPRILHIIALSCHFFCLGCSPSSPPALPGEQTATDWRAAELGFDLGLVAEPVLPRANTTAASGLNPCTLLCKVGTVKLPGQAGGNALLSACQAEASC